MHTSKPKKSKHDLNSIKYDIMFVQNTLKMLNNILGRKNA